MGLENGVIVLISCVLAYALSQGIKNITDMLRREWRLKNVLAPGGFPSSHTATVSALPMSIYLTEGLTPLFALSIVLLAIVVSDAIYLRNSVGKLATAMNGFHRTKFRTKLGHTPLQVLFGGILGALSSYLVYFVLG
ncbi:divergent PAP2 family protein [Candidatus Woesearchaeota archaeon]|nr:divergent PAP2 family protein [Candidatus Woesearchaeota archaeon]